VVVVAPEGVGKPPLPWAPPLDEALPLLDELAEPEELLDLELLELELLLAEDDPEAPEVGDPLEVLGVVGTCGVVGVDALGQPARARQAKLTATGSTRRRMWRQGF
jgi:hypothetical protein